MHAPKVAEDECVPSLRLVGSAFGEPEMPGGVLLEGMPFEKRVLGISMWLHLAPVAVENVLRASISLRQLATAASFSSYFAMRCRLSELF